MDKNKEQIRIIRATENEISNHLFSVSIFVTLATMAVMVTDFFTRGSFLPARIGFFYLSVVMIYSLHKEIIRWLGEKHEKRQGEIFVYFWVILTTILYMVNFFSHNYYSFSKEGYPIGTLRDLTYLTIEILVVFLFTRALKLLFLLKK
jgi:hypothetical protein